MTNRLLVALGITVCSLSAATAKSATCASCHRAESKGQAATGMALALASGPAAPILQAHSKLTFEQGPYKYLIERKGDQSMYRVTDGKETIEVPVAWAFGLGFAGQTYVLARKGIWYESRVSFYKDIDNLDLTVGARPSVPRDLEEAFGRELSTKGASECFNCHATGALEDGALETSHLRAGVQCERCHEGASAHQAGFLKADAPKAIPPKLAALSTDEISDFCGQCHRTWSQIATTGPHNINNVRFQPYRLTNSKCYDTADARIRCITCHNPHEEVVQPASFYDQRCQACHSGAKGAQAKVCHVAKENCASCHMPKIEIKEAHNKFTDHWIRIVHPNEPFPN